jgi:N-acetylglucosamine-6-phosphate deacetylase
MSDGSIIARHYATGKVIEARWRGGMIADIAEADAGATPEWWIAPGLVDLQINGFAGIDFQRDDLGQADLLTATRGLRAAGCTRFLLTLITDEWTALINRLRQIRALRNRSEELRSSIAGWHVEGPFLSDQPGFCGAHDPAAMSDPSLERIRELRAATGDDPLLLTLAPERAGACDAIALAVSLGMKISLGHTNASASELRRATAAGATGFTHLGNACPRELDRHDNILWRALDGGGLMVGLIPDAIHVSPPLFRIIHRLLAPKTVYYTTDAMAAAGAPPGRYRIGRLELEVGADQIVRQPGRTNFAGSALSPIEGVSRAGAMLGCDWRDVWDRFSQIPADWMALGGGLSEGAEASFCLIRCGTKAGPENLRVYWKGNAVGSHPG